MVSKRIILFYRLFNGGLVLLFIVVAVVTFHDAYDLEGTKFPGFLVYKNRMVSPVSLPHWSGPKSGILFPYRIDSIDGKTVYDVSDLQDHLAQTTIDQELSFHLKHPTKEKEAASITTTLQPNDLLSLYGLLFVIAMIFFFCGFIGWFARAERGTAQALFLFSTLAALFFLLTFDMSSTYRFYRLYLAVVALLPASLLQLSLYFPTPREFLKRFPSAQWYPYGLSAFIILLLQLYFYQAPDFWLLTYQFNQALILFSGFVFILTAVAFHRESASILVRLQARTLLIGAVVALGLPLLFLAAGRLLDVHLSRDLVMGFSVFLPISILYAAVKHDLFPMNAAQKKTIVLTFMTSVFSLGFVAMILLTGRWAPSEVLQDPLFLVILFVIFLLLGGLFYGWEEGVFQRTLSRRTERYRQLVEDLNRSLQQFRDERGIAEAFLSRVVETVGLEGGAVFIKDLKGEKFHLCAGGVPSGTGEIDLEAVHRGIFTEIRDGIEVSALFQKPGGRELGQWGVGTVGLKEGDYLLPVFFQDDLIAMVILGEKREGDPYNPHDTALLKAVIGNFTVALANARSYRRLEEQTHRMIQQEKMASLGVLTAGLGHEIRNSLNVIGNYLEVFDRRMASLKTLSQEDWEGMVRGVRHSKDQIRRALEVCENLSEFSREWSAPLEEFDLHYYLDLALTLANNLLKDKMTVHKEYCEEGRMEGKPGWLNHIWMNLITNAAQSIEGEGNLWIHTERNEQYMFVTIRDDGPGIPKENLSKIFDPFFTTKGPGKGTGLGLYLTYQILDRCQGKIEVNSEEGEGTTFRVTLPLRFRFKKEGSHV